MTNFSKKKVGTLINLLNFNIFDSLTREINPMHLKTKIENAHIISSKA